MGGFGKRTDWAIARAYDRLVQTDGRGETNGNPMHPMIAQLLAAPRCHARTRSGKSCRSLAVAERAGAGCMVASVTAHHAARPMVSGSMGPDY